MNRFAAFHRDHLHARRVRILCKIFAEIIPPQASVLDVGCGDGQVAQLLVQLRPDLNIQGTDVLVRPDVKIAVTPFDGDHLPFADASFDIVMLVDVLHHTDDPNILLREAARVAGQAVILKDHLLRGIGAGKILRVMDWMGNAAYGVRLPYNYWRLERWQEAFANANLQIDLIDTHPRLYPFPTNLVFGRGLHFIARLTLKR